MTKIMKAYVLINTTVGREKEIMNGLEELSGVKQVHLLAGEYDVLAELELHVKLDPIHLYNTDEEIMTLVTEKIRKVPGITGTRTVIPVAGSSQSKNLTETEKTRKGFVFVQTTTGKENKVTQELIKLPEVHEVHLITGSQDLLAEVWVERYISPYQAGIMSIVTDKIQKIKEISHTETYISEQIQNRAQLQAVAAR